MGFKTKTKFSDNDVSVRYFNVGWWGDTGKECTAHFCHSSTHFSFSVGTNGLWGQKKRDVMDVV